MTVGATNCEAGKAGLFVTTVRASLEAQLGQPTVRPDRLRFSQQLGHLAVRQLRHLPVRPTRLGSSWQLELSSDTVETPT